MYTSPHVVQDFLLVILIVILNKYSTYVIDRCRFEDNIAVYHLNVNEPEDLAVVFL